jgi:uncharacterized protein YaaR (DUF327 family)
MNIKRILALSENIEFMCSSLEEYSCVSREFNVLKMLIDMGSCDPLKDINSEAYLALNDMFEQVLVYLINRSCFHGCTDGDGIASYIKEFEFMIRSKVVSEKLLSSFYEDLEENILKDKALEEVALKKVSEGVDVSGSVMISERVLSDISAVENVLTKFVNDENLMTKWVESRNIVPIEDRLEKSLKKIYDKLDPDAQKRVDSVKKNLDVIGKRREEEKKNRRIKPLYEMLKK